jgi:hypothetical protein
MTILFSVLSTLILIGAKFFIPNSDWPSYVLALPFTFLMTYFAFRDLYMKALFLIARSMQSPLDSFPVVPRRSFPSAFKDRSYTKNESLINKRYEGDTQIIDINPLLNHRKKQQNRGQENDPA